MGILLSFYFIKYFFKKQFLKAVPTSECFKD